MSGLSIGVSFDVTDDAVSLLAQRGYDPRNGGRQLRRTIDAELAAPLSEHLLAAACRPGDRVDVYRDGDRLRFDIPRGPTP
jgi:ATP-dependent Clp protease ATP-binding subunit ClpA